MTRRGGRERVLPAERGVVRARPEAGGAASTPSFAATGEPRHRDETGLPSAPRPMRVRDRTFAWGSRTFVVGIINVTPDSFSGDGLLLDGPADRRRSPVDRALELARR